MRLSRLLLAASCVVATSGPLAAQSLRPVQSPELHGTIGGAIDELAGKRAGGVRTKVVNIDTTNDAFLFPSAGSVQGAGGTYFRSDAMIVNHRTTTQRISVGWIAQGVNNSARPLQYFDLNAATPYVLQDFINQSLHQTGLGAVLVSGVTSTGNTDSSATLDGFSRIWTNQPNASGTVSLAFPSMAVLDLLGNSFAYALGMRHDTGYRCNVGIVNLDSAAHTWTVTINGDGPSPITNFNVTVDAVSMKQVAVPAGNYGNLLLALQPNATGFFWSAYGASVDNITGDGWVSHASQP
ncbi:MAG TPA: hypothetical protein VH854_02300 [Thermoanaerobaculia bacterium]|jgi:hypothetical protein|nr:hypothetical protein [Thermoanaerobaculia bacterium]